MDGTGQRENYSCVQRTGDSKLLKSIKGNTIIDCGHPFDEHDWLITTRADRFLLWISRSLARHCLFSSSSSTLWRFRQNATRNRLDCMNNDGGIFPSTVFSHPSVGRTILSFTGHSLMPKWRKYRSARFFLFSLKVDALIEKGSSLHLVIKCFEDDVNVQRWKRERNGTRFLSRQSAHAFLSG